MRVPMTTPMRFLYTQYHTILHGRRILAMITIYTADGTTPPHTSTIRPRRPAQNTNASSSLPRMIRPLLPHSRPFVRKTPDPQTRLMPIYCLALRFGISQLYSIECPSGPLPPTVTNPDLPVLLYNILWLVYTTNCSILKNYPACYIYLLVSFV